jgi:WD40 repeat protein
VFREDGKQVCSAGRDRKIHLWAPKDAKKLEEIGGFEDEVYKLIVDGDSIFSCSGDKNVRQHKLGKKPELVRTFSGHADVVYSMAFHPQSHRLATGSFDGEVRIWSTVDGNLIVRFTASPGHLAVK